VNNLDRKKSLSKESKKVGTKQVLDVCLKAVWCVTHELHRPICMWKRKHSVTTVAKQFIKDQCHYKFKEKNTSQTNTSNDVICHGKNLTNEEQEGHTDIHIWFSLTGPFSVLTPGQDICQ